MAGKAKKKKGPNEELLAVAREARAAGMTYGQYQAEKYLKEQAEQMKKEREAREKALLKKQAEYIKTACQEAGIRTRTCDLRVMSPTSYQLLYPAILDCKDRENI